MDDLLCLDPVGAECFTNIAEYMEFCARVQNFNMFSKNKLEKASAPNLHIRSN